MLRILVYVFMCDQPGPVIQLYYIYIYTHYVHAFRIPLRTIPYQHVSTNSVATMLASTSVSTPDTSNVDKPVSVSVASSLNHKKSIHCKTAGSKRARVCLLLGYLGGWDAAPEAPSSRTRPAWHFWKYGPPQANVYATAPIACLSTPHAT
jgi:hypothetical protein